MTDLLSRYAECLYWFGRYTERTACLARIFEVQTSFARGRASQVNWAWILTLYDDHERFAKTYNAADAASVAWFYVNDRDNPGSMYASIHAARENARTLRALIPTELWLQVNAFYNRFRVLPPASLLENRLSQTCQFVKKECYAQLGVAEATIYRDSAWRFFRLGVLVERADQMSRLLDVRFAMIRHDAADSGLDDFGFWSVLLRSAAAQQAYLRTAAGRRDPETVARFLILDPALPRSLNCCTAELDRVMNELRTSFRLRQAARPLERIELVRELLVQASQDQELVSHLHGFNDAIQRQLIILSEEIAHAFFDAPAPTTTALPDPFDGASGQRQSQSQSQSQSHG